jgi:hypothetical protein
MNKIELLSILDSLYSFVISNDRLFPFCTSARNIGTFSTRWSKRSNVSP